MTKISEMGAAVGERLANSIAESFDANVASLEAMGATDGAQAYFHLAAQTYERALNAVAQNLRTDGASEEAVSEYIGAARQSFHTRFSQAVLGGPGAPPAGSGKPH